MKAKSANSVMRWEGLNHQCRPRNPLPLDVAKVRRVLPYLLISAGLIFYGCLPPSQVKQMETDNTVLRRQVDSLQAEIERLQSSLARAEKSAVQSNETATRVKADTELRLKQFEEQIQVLNDRFEDISNRMANLPGKMRIVEERSTAPSSATAPPSSANGPDTTTRRENTAEMEKLYDAAYQDLVKGQFELSREGFAEFLRRYPQSTLADNAQYWIGESFYAQEDYARSAAEFATVPSTYPSGDKAAAATLKQAYALLAIGQRSEGKKILESVIAKYPNTPEARLAKSRLQEQ